MMDPVFKALSDPTRRRLLDRLNERNGQTLTELCSGLDMARQSVTKHLGLLEQAELVVTLRRGREKLHYLNAAPISDIAERWISHYDRQRVEALADLKRALQGEPNNSPSFVYVTYIETTPERLWLALTDPSFTARYWGRGPSSGWRVGSPVLWRDGPKQEFRDGGQEVLEYDPYRRLAYTWHNYLPEARPRRGWTDEEFAQLVREPLSKVTFDLEPIGRLVKLQVVHDGFAGETEMWRSIQSGWPQVLASLKTLLETEQTLDWPAGTVLADTTGAT
jgi:uncharacterized protein YndB with AHSA1/START domain/DNA-binding transcriptional ArsR family regulator